MGVAERSDCLDDKSRFLAHSTNATPATIEPRLATCALLIPK